MKNKGTTNKDKPEYGKQYRLTGDKDTPAISNGNSWKESEVFKCPSCDKELDNVRVYSECWQNATLKGNSIEDYGSVEELTETIAIECPHCGYDFYPKGEINET